MAHQNIFKSMGYPHPGIEGPLSEDISPDIRLVLSKALQGQELTEADAIALFHAENKDLAALMQTADLMRRSAVGENTSFVVTRNINFTNICYMGCRFCNFAKHKDEAGAEFLAIDQVVERAREAKARGATEICMQGGLAPNIEPDYYRNLVATIKREVPGLHIHAYSPFEIWYGARKNRLSYEDYLRSLKEAGLDSMPGTAAEILDVEVRKVLTRDKLTTEQWIDIIKAAHRVGIPTTSTIMYGHVDEPRHWAAHITLLREIQKETGGFTEFVPLGFVHFETPLFKEDSGVRPGPTREEHIRMHAVARLMLNGWIDNIQASWVKLGPDLAQQMLQCGVNDLGGTLMNESISRAAGGQHGQELTPEEMVGRIRELGRRPVRRNTLYQVVETFDEALTARIPLRETCESAGV